MKYIVASEGERPERTAEPLPAEPVSVRSLTIVAGAVNLIGRNEILHVFLAAIMAAVAIIL